MISSTVLDEIIMVLMRRMGSVGLWLLYCGHREERVVNRVATHVGNLIPPKIPIFTQRTPLEQYNLESESPLRLQGALQYDMIYYIGQPPSVHIIPYP